MAIDISAKTVHTYLNEDQRWIKGGTLYAPADDILLDRSAFSTSVWPNDYLPSGLVLAKIAATGLYGPYGGTTEEVVTLTEGGSGLTSFTITFGGDTTASIDDDATAAQVQAALEALDSIGAGNVIVTGGPLATGPFSLTFSGALSDTDVGAVTTTPTGGSGTVVVAVGTTGGASVGSGGLETAVGFLLVSTPMSPHSTSDVGAAMAVRLDVIRNYLPAVEGPGSLDAAAETELAHHVRFFTYNSVA